MRAAFWVHAASPIAYLVQAVLQTSQLQRILRAIQSMVAMHCMQPTSRAIDICRTLQAAAWDRGQRRTKAACCLALMRNRALGQAFRSWAAYAAHVKVGPQQADFHSCAVL